MATLLPRYRTISVRWSRWPAPAGHDPLGPSLAPSLPGEIEIPDLVVRRRAEPHPPLVVHEEVAQRILGVGERIFDDLAGVGVEAPNHVHVFGRVPDLAVAIDAERIGRGPRARELEL